MDGEGARLVEGAGAGLACPTGDAAALACAVRRLADMPLPVRVTLGEAALRYYEQHFEPRMLSQRLVDIFRELCVFRSKSGNEI